MALRIEYMTTSRWSTGFTGEVVVHNDTAATVHDYEIGFDLAADVVEVWGGVLKASEGGRYVVVDDDDKNDIAPGETARFKFKAYGDAGGCEPVNYTVNGEPVDGQMTDIVNVAAGTGDAAIQKLIDTVPYGTTIRLAKGDFWLDRPLEITRDGIKLEGAGEGLTRLHMTYDDADGHAIHVQGGRTSQVGTLSSSVGEGARTISISGEHGIRAGDTLLITQPNDTAFLDSIGDDHWREDAPLRESLVRVTSVSGSTIKLENGVHFDFSGGKAEVHKIDLLKGIELRNFSLEFGFGAPDAGAFANTLDGFRGTAGVKVDGTLGARLQGVTVNGSPSLGFEFERALYMSASDLEAHGAHNKGEGGNGYAFELRDVFDSGFTDLQDTGMRHSVVFGSWHSSVGNEIHVRYTDRDINFHGGRDHDNVVRVDKSVRNPAHDDLSAVVSINQDGASYGAPTDPAANKAVFGLVWGTKRDDVVQGRDGGAELHGRAGNDVLKGGSGDDLLDGGANDDRLIGGAWTDTALFRYELAAYDISRRDDGKVVVRGPDGTDILDSIERVSFVDESDIPLEHLIINRIHGDSGANTIVGTDGRDWIFGYGGDDVIKGGERADVIDGGSGADLMIGGRGDDVYYVDNTGDEIVEWQDSGRGGYDRVYTTVSRQLESNVEELIVVGNSDRTLVGNNSDNVLVGGGGDDYLDGKLGADVLIGGAGDDTYRIRQTSQKIVEGPTESVNGSDIVESDVSFTLPDHVEDLRLLGSGNLNGTGNRLSNDIRGNDGENVLKGYGGKDYLRGQGGNDVLDGGSGDDILHGGAGGDLLTGGAGADRFVYNSVSESKPGSTYRDVITDFSAADNDVINLSSIDANTGLNGNQQFAFIGGASFSQAGQLRFVGGVLKGNTDADLTPEFEIEVQGVSSLSSGDFWL